MGMTWKDLNVGLGCRWPWEWDHAPTGLWQWKFAPGRVMSMGISGEQPGPSGLVVFPEVDTS